MSEQTKHTPAPWGWDSRNTNYYLLSFSPEAPEQIVAQFERIPMDAIGQADRDLIAAAPDLLAACKAVTPICLAINALIDGDEDLRARFMVQLIAHGLEDDYAHLVEQAIAKAEGRS